MRAGKLGENGQGLAKASLSLVWQCMAQKAGAASAATASGVMGLLDTVAAAVAARGTLGDQAKPAETGQDPSAPAQSLGGDVASHAEPSKEGSGGGWVPAT